MASQSLYKLLLTKLSQLKKRHCFIFYAIIIILVVFIASSSATHHFYTATIDAFFYNDDDASGSEDNIRYYRDVYTQESWPQMDTNISAPGDIPFTAHYCWCGDEKKTFLFQDYVGVFSVVRVLKPQKIVFHYSHLPVIDSFWYNSWFQELKQSVPNLVMRRESSNQLSHCDSEKIIGFALEQISVEGGVYIGDKTILTRVPKEAWSSNYHAIVGGGMNKPEDGIHDDVTRGIIVYSKLGFSSHSIPSKIEQIFKQKLKQKRKCLTVKEFDDKNTMTSTSSSLSSSSNSVKSSSKDFPGTDCIVVTESFYPKDIWNSTTSFGELCRWLFYGRRDRFQVQPDPEGTPLIPMISHVVWMRTNRLFKSNEFKFLHYLSVVSALYVAKFERVYIHGELLPFGKWWDELMEHHKEKVTFIKIEPPETIFQQGVDSPAHQSDVLRLSILLRHGGAYQDRDVVWVSEIPREVRRYQAVACVDWPRNGAWPEVFNMGVMMAKPGAQWLKHFLHTFSYYRDDKWAFNAVMMPYRAYEFHPDTLYVDRHLQVICFKGVCHPAWHEDYIRDIDDVTPVRSFDWRDARAFHFTVPKPPASLSSPEAIRSGNDDMFAEMGRFILEKSGRSDLLRR